MTQGAKNILTSSGLRKTFRMGDSQIQVLKNVNLSVSAGEFIAIEGRSGSGKSTLLHILGALDEPSGGTVMFEGKEIARLPAAQRALLRCAQFGFVFQFYHLLPELNVLENTMLASMIEHSLPAYGSKSAALKDQGAAVAGGDGIGAPPAASAAASQRRGKAAGRDRAGADE